MITTSEDAKFAVEQGLTERDSEFEVSIISENETNGHKMWQYSIIGMPLPATRFEQWIMDDGQKYSLFGCFEHTIEQVVLGEVSGPDHRGEDHPSAAQKS